MKRTPIKRRYTEEYVAELSKKLLEWVETSPTLWLGDFAVQNKMSRPRLHELASTHEDFNQAYEIAKQAQENWLVNGALTRKMETAMCIFSLKNVAGWRDKVEHEHSGSVDLVERINDARQRTLSRISTN